MSALPAIGSASTSAAQSASAKPALRAQLALYEKELTACVNCSSASTTEGQLNIQKLDAAIKTLKTQIGTVPGASSSSAPNEAKSAGSAPAAGRIDVYA